MSETKEYTLHLGEFATVRPGLFKAKVEVVFAGMVHEDTYSIAVKWTWSNNSLAYNLYFSSRQREIVLPAGKMTVIDVGREKILFKYQP